MVAKVLEYSSVKNLDKFISELSNSGFRAEMGPHVVLEDHSELCIYRVFKESKLVAYIVAHYITQYYKAVLSATDSDSDFLRRLLEIKYSGEKWSVPVNPLYIVLFSDEITEFLSRYEDEYPSEETVSVVNHYKSKNPDHHLIPRIVVARLAEEQVP
ncbi:MAG: hypothetical protein QXP67_01785 [Desulfurococcaceae archaeon]